MTSEPSQPRDDLLTIAAIAVAAGCLSAIAHEAMGHGGACLARGGHITQLTSVYFQCAPRSPWIAAAGPAGNLLAALLAWLARGALPPGLPRLRLLLLLVMGFSLCWEAGYAIYGGVLDEGDWAIALGAAFPGFETAWRFGAVLGGLALYSLALRLVGVGVRRFAPAGRARRILAVSWFAAALSACVAAAFYAPDHAAIRQAALEIGAGALPMLAFVRLGETVAGPVEPAVARSLGWLAFAGLLFAGFVATLGRGLP